MGNLIETASSYEGILDKKPKLEFHRKHVVKFTPFTYYNIDVNEALNSVEVLLKSLPQQNYQLIVMNTEIPYLNIPRINNEKKNRILDLYEKELNKKVAFRNLSFYLCFDKEDELVKNLLSSVFKIQSDETSLKSFNPQLASLFGGTEQEPFVFPLERTRTGFKLTNKREHPYASVSFEYRTPQQVVQFGLAHVLSNIPDDFLYILSFYRPSPFEYERLIDKLRKRYADKQTTSGKEVVQELTRVLTDIVNERELLYYYSSVLCLFGNSEKALKAKTVKLLSQISSSCSQQFTNEDYSGLSVFKPAFSFAKNDVNKLKSMKAVRRITLSSFKYMLPVLKHFTGRDDKRGAVYLNASGEPVFISQHNSTGHSLTLGATGSGKSVDITNSSLFEDCTVFVEYIQEDTGSYKTFTQLTEGEDAYFPISLDRPVSLNPFGKHIYKLSAESLCKSLNLDYRMFDEPDIISLETALSSFIPEDFKAHVSVKKSDLEKVFEELSIPPIVQDAVLSKSFDEVKLPLEFDRAKQAFISAILQMMVEGKFSIKREEVNYISQLVVDVYKSHNGKRELNVNDFYKKAREDAESNKFAGEVANGLFPFTSSGEFAGFFDRPTDLNRDFKTMFIELRTLNKEILNPVLLSILQNIMQKFSSPAYQKYSKRVVLDEGWTVFKNPLLKDFLESALRTFRKKGIAINFASQSIDETTSFLVGQTELRYFKFLDDKEVLGKFSFLTDDDKEAIVNIKKPKDYEYKYSVAFAETKSFGKGLVYLVLPSFYYWISTTDSSDKVKRLKAYNKYKDLWEAVLQLSRKANV